MFELAIKTKTIGGREVTCKQFACVRQAKLFPRVGVTIAPLMRRLETFTANPDAKIIGPALADTFERLDQAEAWSLQSALVAGLTVRVDERDVELGAENEGEAERRINMAFGGNLVAFWEAVWFAIEVNFGPLVAAAKGVLVALFAGLDQPPGSASPS